MYPNIWMVHVGAVTLSLALFVLRGGLMLADSALLRHRLLKVLPHIVDTVLLIAGVSLAVILRASPGDHPWLVAKLIALAIYIVLGTIALKRGKTKKIRTVAFFAALLAFAYMVSVALTKQVMPWA